jgi:hypothetical protein
MEIFGLPLHPLIVHAAVVLVPLAALGAVLLVAIPSFRARYGLLTELFAAAGAASALGARFTGPALADARGLAQSPLVQAHMAWGVWAPWPAVLLAVAFPTFLWASTHPDASGATGVRGVAAVLTVAGALVGLALIAFTGHSGAMAVWGR